MGVGRLILSELKGVASPRKSDYDCVQQKSSQKIDGGLRFVQGGVPGLIEHGVGALLDDLFAGELERQRLVVWIFEKGLPFLGSIAGKIGVSGPAEEGALREGKFIGRGH